MIKIGQTNRLTIKRRRDNELFLSGDGGSEIFLKLTEQNDSLQAGDEIEVFIYTDGQGRLLASQQSALAKVGEVAFLKVVSISKVGAFLDWGLPKDLFVPFSEQQQKMQVGRSYLVYVFLDEDNRIAATTYLNDFIHDEAHYLKAGDQVELTIAEPTDLGFKAIVNNQFWGVLYKDEVFQPLKKGQLISGYIKKIRDDHKIDLCLNRERHGKKVDDVAQRILQRLESQGGNLKVTDKSPPELIYDTFACSKKVFKQAVGGLYKKRLIKLTDNGIELN